MWFNNFYKNIKKKHFLQKNTFSKSVVKTTTTTATKTAKKLIFFIIKTVL